MWYFVLYVIIAAWVFRDARKRRLSPVPWTLATAILGPVVVPVYFAKRPLREGETREGGTAWNVLKNFALFWTLTMLVVGVAGLFAASAVVGSTTDEVEQAGAAIGGAIGMGLIFALWFFPMIVALVLGFFLKKSSVVEKGPTGALAALLLAAVLIFGAAGCGKSETSPAASAPAKQGTAANPAEPAKQAKVATLPKALAGAESATLFSANEDGKLEQSTLMEATLGDVYRTLSGVSKSCEAKRSGDRVKIAAVLERGKVEVEFTVAKNGSGETIAIVEDMTIESDRDALPKTAEGAEAHATLMQMLIQFQPAAKQP
jgi:hypothetical protein